MNAKQTKVALKADSLGVTKDFDISHAENILNMKPNGGWVLATDEYELKDGNLIRRNKGKNK